MRHGPVGARDSGSDRLPDVAPVDGSDGDAGQLPDGGSRDAAVFDAGREDGGLAEAGPDDGGAFDGGAFDGGDDTGPDAGPPDAGFVFVPSGVVWAQLETGVLVRLDVESGVLTHPLGETSSAGAIAADGDRILFHAYDFDDPVSSSWLFSFDVASGETTRLRTMQGAPRSMTTTGERVAFVEGGGGAIREGPIAPTGPLSAVEVGNAATYAGDVLVVSTESNTYAIGDSLVLNITCGALAHREAEDDFLCGALDGGRLALYTRAGARTDLHAVGGASYASATWLESGAHIGVRESCEIVTNDPRAEGLFELCPAQIVEAGGTLFAGLVRGGLVELHEGRVVQRLGFAVYPGGLAIAGERVAVGGGYEGDIGVLSLDLSAPRRSSSFEYPLSVALSDDGVVWFADEAGLGRYEPVTREEERLLSMSDAKAVALSPLGLLVARGAAGLHVVDPADPTSTSLLSSTRADLVTACADAAVYLNAGTRVLYTYRGEGGEAVLASLLAPVTGLGCFDDQIFLGYADGRLAARALERPDLEAHLLSLPSPAWHIAGEPGE